MVEGHDDIACDWFGTKPNTLRQIRCDFPQLVGHRALPGRLTSFSSFDIMGWEGASSQLWRLMTAEDRPLCALGQT
jgi:hypothetical protein